MKLVMFALVRIVFTQSIHWHPLASESDSDKKQKMVLWKSVHFPQSVMFSLRPISKNLCSSHTICLVYTHALLTDGSSCELRGHKFIFFFRKENAYYVNVHIIFGKIYFKIPLYIWLWIWNSISWYGW